MKKAHKLVSVVLVLTLLAGFFLLNGQAFAETDSDKLQQVLDVLGVTDGYIVVNGQQAWGRFDRGQVVFGSPLQVPDNDWKNAPPDENGQDWQTANNVDVGHPGEEPRYLGFTLQKDPFSNDWFPNDAPNQSAPAERDMIAEPWNVKSGGKNLCSDNPRGISDYTWGVIKAALADYHEKIGYDNPQDGYACNPVFQGQFDINTIKRYFKVLTEPRPGITGAVREWHYRNGVPWYDTITVRWDVLPDFIVESIDPGTDKARPGETYTGKVILKAKPDGSFLSDPLTGRLFEIMGDALELPKSYSVPVGVSVGNHLIPVKNLQPISKLGNVYRCETPSGVPEYRLELNFSWSVPSDFSGGAVTLAAEVNDTRRILPFGAWEYMEWGEITNANNFKKVDVPVDLPNLVAVSIDPGTSDAEPGGRYTATFTFKNASDEALSGVPVAIFADNQRVAFKYVDLAPKQEANITGTWTAPNASRVAIKGVIDTSPLENRYAETTEKDNTVQEIVPINKQQQGPGSLTFKTVSQNRQIPRPVNTAKWTDWVTAELRPPAPNPPRGSLDWWEITSAELTYPKKNPEFTFGTPYPPVGTKTVKMNPNGHVATVEFQEDWGMDGAKIYSILERRMMAEYPKNYTLTARYTIKYQYSWTESDDEGNSWTETRIATTSGIISGNLLVNGTGVDSRAQ